MFKSFLSAFSTDLGIDLGTANSLVHLRRKGILLREPSVVAINTETNEILAVGEEAKRMLGRTPGSIMAVRPLKDGVIADFDVTEAMLRYFINKVHKRRFFVYPRAVIGVPSGVTEVERRAIKDAALRAGGRQVALVEEPLAAAIGAGLPISEPMGSMIVDVGGGTTEVAVISLGGIVTSHSIRVAGDEIDEAIISYCRKAYNLLIGERTGEWVKIKIGSAYDLGSDDVLEVKGRDLVTGLPKKIKLSTSEVREAISEPVQEIVNAVKLCLEKTPPELAADIMERGIVLCGGGASLKGLDKRISVETGMPVWVTEDPMTTVVMGTGRILEEPSLWSKIVNSDKR